MAEKIEDTARKNAKRTSMRVRSGGTTHLDKDGKPAEKNKTTKTEQVENNAN